MDVSVAKKNNQTIVSILCTAISIVLFCVWTIVYHINTLFSLLLIIWFLLLVHSVIHLHESITELCFLLAFFVFLLGRQVCYLFFHVDEVYAFLDVTNDRTYLCMLVSLVAFAMGSAISENKKKTRFFKKQFKTPSIICSNSYALACKYMFLICYVFQIIVILLQIRYVRSVGYLASYTNEDGGAGIPSLLYYPSSFASVSLCLYLATKPTKKKAMKLLLLYEIYAVLTVFTGQRYPFIGINMFIMSYMFIRDRQEKGWIKPSYYIIALLAVPALMILSTTFDAIRTGRTFTSNGFVQTIIKFLDQQGGSINTIRRTIYNAKELQDLRFVSLSSTRTALLENGISRALFNTKIYAGAGNTIDAAFKGHSLANRLSYIAYGEEYLAGKGTGSSYIAELYHDFGIMGIICGSFLYGYWLKRINLMQFKKRIIGGIGIAMLYYIYLAPRGGFDAFVGYLFRIYTIVFYAIVIILAYFIRSIRKRDFCSESIKA